MNISILLTFFVIVLACVSTLAIVVAVLALRLARKSTRRGKDSKLPTNVEGLRNEVASLKAEVSDALRHLAVVRYDAFGDMGGHLSWSLALLDDSGNGVVLTSIHGRSEARTYAKNITDWKSEQQISPEEEEAIAVAKAS
jgi:uncharacterized protein YlxW (UPF0749 family)